MFNQNISIKNNEKIQEKRFSLEFESKRSCMYVEETCYDWDNYMSKI